MKVKNEIVLLTFLFSILSCGEGMDKTETSINENSKISVDAYVVGYHPCTNYMVNSETGIADSYLLITSDEKDTLLTIDLPKDIWLFPADCFNNDDDAFAFPNKYDKAFKTKITYKIVPSEEEREYVCNHLINLNSKFSGNYKQIKIELASEINPLFIKPGK